MTKTEITSYSDSGPAFVDIYGDSDESFVMGRRISTKTIANIAEIGKVRTCSYCHSKTNLHKNCEKCGAPE